MCGIAGLVSAEHLTGSDRRSVEPMLDALRHRGPDGRGTHHDDHAILGHTRLAIIDPLGGRQPIPNENRTVWTVVNGEIYNHRDLRNDLESKGHRFTTHSDSETVLHLYEELGPACVEKLRGIFALAVWDADRRTLLLARDPLGVKPLYYMRVGPRFYFASRLDALLATGAVKPVVHPPSLHNYLVYHYVPSPDTILRGVHKLAPAQRLVLRGNALRTDFYWDLDFQTDTHRRAADWDSDIRRALQDAVTANLTADVPLGAFLSAGLDSSAVVAAISAASPDPVRTYTVGFDNKLFDERHDARRFARRFATRHHDQCVTPDPRDIVETLAAAFDEPFADPSAVPTYYVSRLAARHVKAVLSGDGGDELFAGYSRYTHRHRQRLIRRCIASPSTRRAIHACAEPFGARVRNAVRQITSADDLAHYLGVAWFDPDETRDMLNPDFARQIADHDAFDVLRHHFQRCNARNPLARSQYVDLKTWLADGVLCKTDRAAMACGLEVRVPLLDIPLAELAATIPPRLKIHRGRGKHALRRALQPVLGRNVTLRPKQGFEVPLDEWFAGPLHAFARDAINASDTRLSQWIAPDAVDHAWTRLRQHRPGAGARLWALLMLELWARRNLAAPAPTAQPDEHGATAAMTGSAA